MNKTMKRLIIAILVVILLGIFGVVFLIGSIASAAQYSSDFAGVLSMFVDMVKELGKVVIDLAKLSLGIVP